MFSHKSISGRRSGSFRFQKDSKKKWVRKSQDFKKKASR